MTEDSNQLFHFPCPKEPETVEELYSQIAVLSEAIGKCEKMLQNLIVGGFGQSSSEIDIYMSHHIQLVSMKNKLEKKLKNNQEGTYATTTN